MRVVIVGGGIVGFSAAYRLGGAGVETVVVDRADAGQATAAGAGIVCPWVSHVEDTATFQVAAEASRYYPELIEELAEDGEADSGYAKVGALFVGDQGDALLDEMYRCLLERRAAGWSEIGEVAQLDSGGPREVFPYLRDDLAGVHLTGASRVDGQRLALVLRRASVRRGVRVVDGEATLVRDGDRVTGVRVGAELIEADAVVLSAGAWSAELAKGIGVELPVSPQRGQIIHLVAPDVGMDTAGMPIVERAGSGHYLLAFPNSHIVVGATREPDVGFEHRVTAAGVAEVLANALSVAPGLAESTMLETRVGFRPASADKRALLGAVDGLGGLVVATGLGPTGLTMGPYVGVLAAGLAVGEQPAIDLTPFAPSRRIG